MEVSHVSMKVLLFLGIIFSQTSADTHTLQFLYTAVTPGVNFTAVGLVDGDEIVYYDVNIRKMIPTSRKIDAADDPEVWKPQTQLMQSDQENLKQLLLEVMKDFNHTEGVHTLQRRYGCELHDYRTTRGYDQYRYDGEDFLSLDLKTGTWTAAKRQAEIIKEKWESTGDHAKYWKRYLEKECIKQLMKFVDSYLVVYKRPRDGGEVMDRKSVYTYSVLEWIWVIIASVAFLTIFIICVAGFAVWRKRKNDSKSVLTPGSPNSSSKLFLPPEF
ncbi:hypothetical protein AMELA_G00242540 [Ameiurus melas]|uniref:MHC class I-like antigen recognition-like domain-containing protein n=1 Tax=Ameiurus melas TaxID=219545 RepID=A0A7J5ZWC1_AMEME|nr:hypothetical protein AMELA_G00242540 [Ameiurus melas]